MPSIRPAASPPLLLLLLASLGWLPSCASSTPAAVADAQFPRVTFWDFRTDAQLVLVTEDDPEYQDLYSQPRNNANIKLANREALAQLIEFSADRGFFEYAQEISNPEEMVMGNAYGMIVIRADQTNHAFVFEHEMGQRDRNSVEAFTDIQREIARVYNQTRSLQFISSATDGRTYFEAERSRIQRENARRTQGESP